MTQLHPLLQPYKPTDADPYDAVKAAHLLNRAAFGGNSEEIARVVELGPQGAIDALMDFPDAGVDEQSQTDLPDLSSIDGYPQNFRAYRQMLAGKTQEERKALFQQLMQANREALMETVKWWLNRMCYGPYPMQEKLTFFWHGHFTSSARDERSALLMWNQNELLRRQSAGNFREFVRQVSRDPAMLDYLNNTQNHKQHPNENYARELMELFTLGIGNYTEDDIKNSARSFTGWEHDGEDFYFNRYQHDDGIKTFMGRRGNFNGDDIIDIILQQHACAPFITGEIFKYFAYEDPEDGVAESLGQLLRESNWELRPVLRTIFTSKAFYQPRAIGSQIKSPVQLVAGTIKLLDLKTPDARRLSYSMEQMGQVPMEPPNVKGWPGGRMWINTSTLFVRYNTCVFLAGGTMPGGQQKGMFSKNPKAAKPGPDVTGKFNPDSMDQGSPTEIVDYWLGQLIQRPVDQKQKDILIAALGDRPKEGDVRHMIQLIMSMPEYQLC